MGAFEVRTTIDRPVDEVFEVFSHIENNARWSSLVLEAEQTTPQPPGLGTRGTTVGKFLGMRIKSEIEITEFVQNEMFAYRSVAGPVERWGRVTFEPAGSGTCISITVGGDAKGYFRVASRSCSAWASVSSRAIWKRSKR